MVGAGVGGAEGISVVGTAVVGVAVEGGTVGGVMTASVLLLQRSVAPHTPPTVAAATSATAAITRIQRRWRKIPPGIGCAVKTSESTTRAEGMRGGLPPVAVSEEDRWV